MDNKNRILIVLLILFITVSICFYNYNDEYKQNNDLLDLVMTDYDESDIMYFNGVIPLNASHGLIVNLKKYNDEIVFDKKSNIENEVQSGMDVYLDFLGNKIYFWGDKSRITIYNTKDKEYAIYYIPNELYEEVWFGAHLSSYIGNSTISDLIFSGTYVKNSNNDVPINDSYLRFQFYNNDAFIYANDEKYYCEMPYVFVKEISKEVYIEGYEFITEKIIKDGV